MGIEVTLCCKICGCLDYIYPVDGFDLYNIVNDYGWEIGYDEGSDICPECLANRRYCAVCDDEFFEDEDTFVALDALGREFALCPEHTRYHAMYRQPA